ncbi:MAG TPA: hypothetical protein VGM78_03260, partial [Ilumatobacteraceae bacterium]
QRSAGDVITGGTSPDQVATLLSEGRQLMGDGDSSEALQRYMSVLDIDANNVEARTYAGWILANSSLSEPTEVANSTLANGEKFLQQAITLDPTYADPHCFLALIAGVIDNDTPTALSREKECLALDPSSDMQGLMTEYIDPLKDPPTTTQ